VPTEKEWKVTKLPPVPPEEVDGYKPEQQYVRRGSRKIISKGADSKGTTVMSRQGKVHIPSLDEIEGNNE